MNVIKFDNEEQIGVAAGYYMCGQVLQKPDSVLGLATGSTPVKAYKHMIELYNQKAVDFSKVTTFNLDEYVNLDVRDRNSYHTFMYENLFDHINIPDRNINFLDGNAPDLEEECRAYERRIKRAGGIDIQLFSRLMNQGGNPLQHLIAFLMTVGIVDMLEVVQIDHDNAGCVFPVGLLLFLLHPLCDPPLDLAPVIELRQLIGDGHEGQGGIRLHDLGGGGIDEVDQAVDHGHGGLIFSRFPMNDSGALTAGIALPQAGNDQRQIMMVHAALPPDQLPGGAEPVGRGHLMEGEDLPGGFRAAPERLPAETVENGNHLRREIADCLHALHDILHDGFRIAVGHVENAALGDPGAHCQGAVFIAGHGMAQQGPVVMLHGEGELQGVIENMIVIGNAQIVLIDLIGGLAVQLMEDISVRPGHLQGIPQGLPPADIGVLDMEIRAADKGHQDTGAAEIAALAEQEGLEGVIAEGAAAPDRDILRDLLLNDPADIPDRNGINGGDHLDGFYIPEGGHIRAKILPESRKAFLIQREEQRLRKTVRLFENGAGDDQLLRGDPAVKNASGCGRSHVRGAGHQLIDHGAGGFNLRPVRTVRKQMDQGRTGSAGGLPFGNGGAEGGFIVIYCLEMLHSGYISLIYHVVYCNFIIPQALCQCGRTGRKRKKAEFCLSFAL